MEKCSRSGKKQACSAASNKWKSAAEVGRSRPVQLPQTNGKVQQKWEEAGLFSCLKQMEKCSRSGKKQACSVASNKWKSAAEVERSRPVQLPQTNGKVQQKWEEAGLFSCLKQMEKCSRSGKKQACSVASNKWKSAAEVGRSRPVQLPQTNGKVQQKWEEAGLFSCLKQMKKCSRSGKKQACSVASNKWKSAAEVGRSRPVQLPQTNGKVQQKWKEAGLFSCLKQMETEVEFN